MYRLIRRTAIVLTAISVSLISAGVSAADFPVKGKPIEMIVPFGAGGPTDAAARLLASSLEQSLGTAVTVLNKPGASTQIGATQLARARPDGHTIGFVSLPQLITAYRDPARKAVFSRKDLQPFALHVSDPVVVVVRSDSPLRSLTDLIAAAKAKPNTVKGGTGGFMGTTYFAFLELERLAGIRFALVNFEGSAPGVAALLGGHIDVHMDTVAGAYARSKSGEVRVLAVADSEVNAFLPNVRTFESQGVPLRIAASRGLALPAGTPREVEKTLSEAVKAIVQTSEHRDRMTAMGQTVRFMGSEDFSKLWADAEELVDRLMATPRQQ